MCRILVKYKKVERMKFISHLELIRVIERALRRAEIPLKFTQGYNPHPIISFASPLSVGISSEGEYLELEVNEKIDLDEFLLRLNNVLPKGIEFIKCKYLNEKGKALMSLVDYATYLVKCKISKKHNEEQIRRRINEFLNKEEIIYTKKSSKNKKKEKKINIKEMIKEISVINAVEDEVILKMNLATGGKGNLKPEIVMKKLMELENIDINLDSIRIVRLETFTRDNQGKLIPLEYIK